MWLAIAVALVIVGGFFGVRWFSVWMSRRERARDPKDFDSLQATLDAELELRHYTILAVAVIALLLGFRWLELRHSTETERLRIETVRVESEKLRADAELERVRAAIAAEKARLELEQASAVVTHLAAIGASTLSPEEKKRALDLSLQFYIDLGVLTAKTAKSVKDLLDGTGKALEGAGKFFDGLGKGFAAVAQVFRSAHPDGSPGGSSPCCSVVRETGCCSPGCPPGPPVRPQPSRSSRPTSRPCDPPAVSTTTPAAPRK